MDLILNSFDNRDVALLLWLLVLGLWVLWKPAFRRSVGVIVRALLQWKILLVFSVSALTTVLLSYALSLVGLWTLSQLKGSVFWFIAACVPSIMDVPRLSEDFSLFRAFALKNFKLAVLVDFYLNLFDAPLLVELALLPAAALLIAMIVVSERRADLKAAHGILTNSLALVGFCWAGFQLLKLVTSFEEILSLDTLRDFVLPIALSLAFLPILITYAVCAAYDSVFARVRFVVKDPALHRHTKFALIARCGFNYMRLHRWFKNAWQLDLRTRADILESIRRA